MEDGLKVRDMLNRSELMLSEQIARLVRSEFCVRSAFLYLWRIEGYRVSLS